MSNTNLTDGRSHLCFFMINCERNRLNDGEKAGDASKVNQETAKGLSINLGVSDMVIPTSSLSIDKEGHRGDKSQRKDMEKMDYKVKRMKEINSAKLKGKETKKKDSEQGHENR